MRWLAAIACSLILLACDTTEQATPPQSPAQVVPRGTMPAQPGQFKDLVANLPGINVHWLGSETEPELLVLDITQDAFAPSLIAYPESGISAQQAMQQHNLAVLVGSGFVSTTDNLRPVGLLRQEGQTFSDVELHGYTRILGISAQGLGVVHRKQYEDSLFHSALQAGPGIIEHGELDISERDLRRPTYFRSFVGLCDQRWLVGISLAPTHLRTLGEQLVEFTQQQKWRCMEVVNLAGDRQAVLMLRKADNNLVYHGDPDTHKVSMLGFATMP